MAVARNIAAFKYDPSRCAFKTWLLALARSRIVDRIRRRGRQEAGRVHWPEESGTTAKLENIPDPAGMDLEAAWDEEWEKNLLAVAVERVKQRSNPVHYQLFDLYVFKDWPVREICAKLGVIATQVYLAKHRISAMIKVEVRRLEKQVAEGKVVAIVSEAVNREQ